MKGEKWYNFLGVPSIIKTTTDERNGAMKAVIVAGGEGKGLRPLTLYTPKPMVNVLNRPIMEYAVDLLKRNGITEIGVTLHRFPSMVQDHFGDGNRFGVHFCYFQERKALGTAGGIRYAEAFLSDDFLVMGASCVADFDLASAISFHRENNAMVTVIITRETKSRETVILGKDERIKSFMYPGEGGGEDHTWGNTGIYILSKKILSYFPEDSNIDFTRDLFPFLLEQEERIFGYPCEGYFCDVTDMQSYRQCHHDLLDGKGNALPKDILQGKGVFLEKGAFLEVGVAITPPVYIGENTYVESGAEILPYSVIGSSCVIGEGARIAECIVDCGGYLDEGSFIEGAVLGKKVTMKKNAKAYQGTVIGDDTVLGAEVIVKPDIHIWPNKIISDGSIVGKNIVNSEGLKRNLFGYRGITGVPGVDFTPENISKIGACFGVMNQMGKLAIAYDGHPVSYMAHTALLSGTMSSGVKVYDFGENLLSVVRSAVGFYGLKGGIYISFRDRQIHLDFLSQEGANIDRPMQQKLELLIEKEDFARASSHLIETPLKLESYKNYHFKVMVKQFSLHHIDRFVYLKTASSLVEQYCNQLFREVMIKPIRLKDKILKNGEITACISEDGERLTLYAEDGNEIKNDKLFMILILILLEEGHKNIVVPPYLSQKAIALAKNSGAEVTVSANTDAAFMKELLRQHAFSEFQLCYDAVYALAKLMEYLSIKKLQLCDISRNLPEIFKARTKVRTVFGKAEKAIRELSESQGQEPPQFLDGIKIHKKDGWVFIVPDSKKTSFTIITEGISEEYANELCDFYANKLCEDTGEK